MDGDQALENIIYGRALNSEHQLDLLNSLSQNFATGEFRLLIIDSIMACFRVDYCGRGELADRQQKLNQMMSKLTHMAEEFNVAVFMTNQVQSDPGASALFAGADGRKPVGGHILAHASQTRILLVGWQPGSRLEYGTDRYGSVREEVMRGLQSCRIVRIVRKRRRLISSPQGQKVFSLLPFVSC